MPLGFGEWNSGARVRSATRVTARNGRSCTEGLSGVFGDSGPRTRSIQAERGAASFPITSAPRFSRRAEEEVEVHHVRGSCRLAGDEYVRTCVLIGPASSAAWPSIVTTYAPPGVGSTRMVARIPSGITSTIGSIAFESCATSVS